jgi:hypothetical protein
MFEQRTIFCSSLWLIAKQDAWLDVIWRLASSITRSFNGRCMRIIGDPMSLLYGKRTMIETLSQFTSSKGRGPMQALNMVRLLLNDLLKRFARASLPDGIRATFPPSSWLFMASTAQFKNQFSRNVIKCTCIYFDSCANSACNCSPGLAVSRSHSAHLTLRQHRHNS